MTPQTGSDDDRNQRFGTLRKRIVSSIARRFGYQRAEDMAQNVMLVLLRRYPDLKEEDLARVAYKIKAKIGLEEITRRHPSQEPEHGWGDLTDDRPTPERSLIQREVAARLEAGIARLEKRCKELIRYRLSEMESKEIAQRLNVTIDTLFVVEKRCRDRLKKLMLGKEAVEHG
jgi:RNA polymerase sigma factor (sigma-70 family)